MISWEWVIVGIAALLLFGGRRLPQLAKDLGAGIKAFRKALTDADEDTQPKKIQPPHYGYDTPPPPPPPNYYQQPQAGTNPQSTSNGATASTPHREKVAKGEEKVEEAVVVEESKK